MQEINSDYSLNNREILFPFASRLFPKNKREVGDSVRALIGKDDRIFFEDVSRGLYPQAFDLYLAGDIVREAYSNRIQSYEKIEIVAAAPLESIRNNFIKVLRNTQKEKGSDAWMHFGFTTQRQEGFSIKDIRHGSMFYVEELRSSPEECEFKLTPAVYETQKSDPSPIHLHLPPSLEGYRIMENSGGR